MAILTIANVAASQQTMTDWLDRRMTIIEGQNIDGRLRVLESDMIELKMLSRGVAAAVIGQFAIAGFGILRKAKP